MDTAGLMKAPRRHRLADVHRDSNEAPLIELAEQLGAQWFPGPPLDGWLLFRKTWIAIECKRPEREGTAGEYTPLQKQFISRCQLHDGPYAIWRDAKDVMKTLGAKVSA